MDRKLILLNSTFNRVFRTAEVAPNSNRGKVLREKLQIALSMYHAKVPLDQRERPSDTSKRLLKIRDMALNLKMALKDLDTQVILDLCLLEPPGYFSSKKLNELEKSLGETAHAFHFVGSEYGGLSSRGAPSDYAGDSLVRKLCSIFLEYTCWSEDEQGIFDEMVARIGDLIVMVLDDAQIPHGKMWLKTPNASRRKSAADRGRLGKKIAKEVKVLMKQRHESPFRSSALNV